MHSHRRLVLWLAIGLSMLAVGSAALGARAPGRRERTARQSGIRTTPPAREQMTAGYVGSEACKDCHDDIFKDFVDTPHRRTMQWSRDVSLQGCEACHGPGKEHVEAGGDAAKIISFKRLSSSATNERCLECHRFEPERANFRRAAHAGNDVSCIDCHATHRPRQRESLLARAQPQLCYRCHLSARPQFAKPFRHRVEEGLLACSDCHNPHGGFLTRQLRTTAAQDAICFRCHVDKEGPFVFEHPVVKTEGCVSCHIPHGSTNPHMLRRSSINLVCLECHTFTVDSPIPGVPSFHNQAQKYQACTLCHVMVHGSNASKVFFR